MPCLAPLSATNATTHLKRPEDAISARKMPKFTPKDNKNWGVQVKRHNADGSIVLKADGEAEMIKVRMAPGQFPDGSPHDFYYPDNDPLHPGKFKGMAQILKEKGHGDMSKVCAQCEGFKCPPRDPDSAPECCCRRILFEETDFVNAKSILQEFCESQEIEVMFLPKFHCELNPIKMCWGRAKYHYRHYPHSSKEDNLRANMIKALESVTLTEMRRWVAYFCPRFNSLILGSGSLEGAPSLPRPINSV
jgi:hypothetical protein